MSSLRHLLTARDMVPGAGESPLTTRRSWRICILLDARRLGRILVLDSISRVGAIRTAGGLLAIYKLVAQERTRSSDLSLPLEWSFMCQLSPQLWSQLGLTDKRRWWQRGLCMLSASVPGYDKVVMLPRLGDD